MTEVICFEKRKARKEHQCWGCGKPINKNEIYQYQFCKEGGDVWDVKCHVVCQELISRYWENFGYEECQPIHEWFCWNLRREEYECQACDLSNSEIDELRQTWLKIMELNVREKNDG